MDRIAVLDLGATRAAAVVAELDDRNKLRVVASATAPNRGIRKGIVADLEEAYRAIDDVMRQIETQVGEPVRHLVVGIGGAHVEATTVKGIHPIYPKSRPITRDDLLQVVTHSRQQLLPPDREELQSIPQSYTVDGQRGIRKPLGMNGSRLEVETLLVTAQRSQVQNLEGVVERSGRSVVALVANFLAAGLGCMKPEELELGAVVIDLGAGCTTVSVFDGGSIVFATTIPLGASHITSDVMKLLKTSPEEAERLKTTYGCAVAALTPPDDSIGVLQLGQIHERPMQRRVLCEIVESRAKEIATFAKQQLERSGYYGILPAGVVLTGGGSKLDGIDSLFADLVPGHKIRRSAPRTVGSPSIDEPEWSVAAGLARHGLENETESISAASANGIGERVKTIWSLLSGKGSSL